MFVLMRIIIQSIKDIYKGIYTGIIFNDNTLNERVKILNEVIDCILTRQSIRHFIPEKQIEESKLEAIVNSGLAAPNAGNVQAWQIMVVKNHKVKEEIMKAALRQSFISQAPVVIIVSADRKAAMETYSYRGANLYVFQDTAAMTQNILLAAHSLGLGACWVGAFNDERVRAILELEENILPVVVIPMGYYEQTARKTSRSKEVVKYVN